MKSLIVVYSYHHNNTEKIADALVKVIGAPEKTPRQVRPEELSGYDLIGFGAGIYSATFNPSVFDLADRLPQATEKKAFLFSTYGAPSFIANRNSSRRTTSRSGKSYWRKGMKLSVNSVVQGGIQTVS